MSVALPQAASTQMFAGGEVRGSHGYPKIFERYFALAFIPRAICPDTSARRVLALARLHNKLQLLGCAH